MAVKLSRQGWISGRMTPPLPSPAMTARGSSGERFLDDVDLADLRPEDFDPLLRGDVVDGPGRREVADDRPLLAAEDVLDGQGQGQLLAERPAFFVDDRQPVGVGVLDEPDVRPGLRPRSGRSRGCSPASARTAWANEPSGSALMRTISQPSASRSRGARIAPAPLLQSRTTLSFRRRMRPASKRSRSFFRWARPRRSSVRTGLGSSPAGTKANSPWW